MHVFAGFLSDAIIYEQSTCEMRVAQHGAAYSSRFCISIRSADSRQSPHFLRARGFFAQAMAYRRRLAQAVHSAPARAPPPSHTTWPFDQISDVVAILPPNPLCFADV